MADGSFDKSRPYSRRLSCSEHAADKASPLRTLVRICQASTEDALTRCQPLQNCLLFFVGCFAAVLHPPAYLSWLRIPTRLVAVSDDWRPLIVKLALYLGCCALVLVVTDGAGSRRICASLLFPFAPSWGVAVNAFATSVAGRCMFAAGAWWQTIADAALFGLIAALSIGVPLAVLYRTRVAALSALVLAPAAAHTLAPELQSLGTAGYPHLLLDGSRYIACLAEVSGVYALMQACGFSTHFAGSSSDPAGPLDRI